MSDKFLLVGDPARPWRQTLQEALKPLGKLCALTEQEALAAVFDESYDVVIVDATAVDQLEEMITSYSSQINPPHVIVMTAVPTSELALVAFRAGASDCVPKYRRKEELEFFFANLVANSNAAQAARVS